MENSIIQKVKSYISPELISNLGVTTNESEANLSKGFDVAISTIFASLFSKDKSALSGLLQNVKNIFTDDSTDIASKLSNAPALLSDLFDGHKDDVVKSISDAANISSSSAEAVLSSSSLGVFGYLKQIAPDWDLGTITNSIATHMPSIKSLLPAGIAIPGLANLFDTHTEKVSPVVNVPPVPKAPEVVVPPVHQNFSNKEIKKEGSSVWKILIPLLLGIVLIFILYRSCNEHFISTSDTVKTDSLTIENPVTPAVDNGTAAIREKFKVELPNGVTIDAYKGGIEDKLVAFLKTNYKSKSEDELKKIWFDFDDLNFETGKAIVTAESKVQLDNIVAILKAFPESKIKIGGYTDKTGNESFNLKLSSDRATAVRNFIADAGLGAQVTGAEGYGSQFATQEATATEEQRALDRRISVSPR